ncbi:MAG: hypothetical protein H0U72_03135 [Nitrosospira sp.]|nr:hypothetical protein [Nitrosospira sp.]
MKSDTDLEKNLVRTRKVVSATSFAPSSEIIKAALTANRPIGNGMRIIVPQHKSLAGNIATS